VRGKRRASPARGFGPRAWLVQQCPGATMATPHRRLWPRQRGGRQRPAAVSGHEWMRRGAHLDRDEKANAMVPLEGREEERSWEVSTAADSGEQRWHHRGGYGPSSPHLGETAVLEVGYVEARLTRKLVELRAKARRRRRARRLRQWSAAARWRGAWRCSEMKGARGERELARRLRHGRERPWMCSRPGAGAPTG
jgi:hypothetical protein